MDGTGSDKQVCNPANGLPEKPVRPAGSPSAARPEPETVPGAAKTIISPPAAAAMKATSKRYLRTVDET